MPTETRSARGRMLNAADGYDGNNVYSPGSVQQAPGKRGAKRPESYRSGMMDMNKKLEKAQPSFSPQAVWFLTGALLFVVLYLVNALLNRA